MKILIGSHVGVSAPNYLLKSAQDTVSYGANCLMIYTGSPQSTTRLPITSLKINEFHSCLEKNSISLSNIVVHAPYIINLATNDIEKRNFGIDFISNEIKRTKLIGSRKFVIHPGNATNCDKETAIRNIADSINKINRKSKNKDVIICLETMSGKGSEVGRKFEELKKIIDFVENKELIGVCLDTCHIHDAGYDVINFDKTLEEFDSIIGSCFIKVIHLNDSKNIIGASKDRHENIGKGLIGFDALQKVLFNKSLENIPKILETPWIDGKPPYKEEIANLLKKTNVS